MDQFRKKRPAWKLVGRMPWDMVAQGTASAFQTARWVPAADVYETDSAIIVCMDVSGVEPSTLAVMAEESQVTVSGVRGYEQSDMMSCVHRLEIDRGFFERSIPLPKPVDVTKAVSESKNGFLHIVMPLRRNKGKIRITVR